MDIKRIMFLLSIENVSWILTASCVNINLKVCFFFHFISIKLVITLINGA